MVTLTPDTKFYRLLITLLQPIKCVENRFYSGGSRILPYGCVTLFCGRGEGGGVTNNDVNS